VYATPSAGNTPSRLVHTRSGCTMRSRSLSPSIALGGRHDRPNARRDFLWLLLPLSPAFAEAQSVGFSQIKGWNIDAVYDESRTFQFCHGIKVHPDDTYFSIYLSASGEWALFLYNEAWSGQPGATFRVDLYVDGKLVDTNRAEWLESGHGAGIQFGRSLSSIKALMLGNRLTIVSEHGNSAFSLFGSYAATLKVADCYDNQQRMMPNTGGGAFFNAQDPRAQKQSQDTQIASRAETLGVVTTYLGGSAIPYKILPESGNQIEAMPVNWTYGANSIGGMAIFLNSPRTSEEALTIMLKEQAGVCTGKSAIDRQPPKTTEDGVLSTALGMCQTSEGTFSASWKVAKVGNNVMIIMELLDLGDAEANPSLKAEPEFSGQLLSNFPTR
jgi:hypothetical protein